MEDPLRSLKDATQTAVLTSPGAVSPETRQQLARGQAPADLQALAERIRTTPWAVSDADWAALDGKTEDEKFEIVLAIVIGAAQDRYDAALRALEGA